MAIKIKTKKVTPDEIESIQLLLLEIKDKIKSVEQLLFKITGETISVSEKISKKIKKLELEKDLEERVIEGIFDGQNMIGPDQKHFSVPANYASKSKLVEGDVLKLTIDRDGSFIFKQIDPVERRKVIGKIVRDKDSNSYKVLAEERFYKILPASITYFKIEPGDEVTLVIPKEGISKWGAVENVVKKTEKLSVDKKIKEEILEDIDKDIEEKSEVSIKESVGK